MTFLRGYSKYILIEQISTNASFFLKLVQSSFLYRVYQLQILNSGCGLCGFCIGLDSFFLYQAIVFNELS